MPNKEVTIQTQEEFLRDVIVKAPEASYIRVFAPKTGTTPSDKNDSLITQLFNTLTEAINRGADAQLITDRRYSDYTRVGIRTLPNWWPLSSEEEREIRKTNAASTRIYLDQLENSGILQDLRPRTQSSAHSTTIRRLASWHPLQHWAIAHQKGAIIDSSFTISTGNLTTSDYNEMNNLAIRFDGDHGKEMASFVSELMSPEAKLREAGGHTLELDNITLIHDYNNVGDPARLPLIHQVAEKLINPSRDERISKYIFGQKLATKKPEMIVYLSPYVPDGTLAVMLDRAQKDGSKVVVPRQPPEDYREKAFPYNLQTSVSCINKANILRPRREKPSHVKCLVVKYDNGTAAILFGSDNYLTSLQKFVRNEEIAVLMQIEANSTEQLSTYNNIISKLFETGEIDEERYLQLKLSV